MRLPASPKKAENLLSVNSAETSIDITNPASRKLKNFRLLLDSSRLLFSVIKQCPANQLPAIESIQNFGELKGSCSAGLKYKVIRAPEIKINQTGPDSIFDFRVTDFMPLSY
jgi:hypothetical protein